MAIPDVERTAEAFQLLSTPDRVTLLLELWREGRQESVAYSRLRDAVPIDDSGRFTYHLQQLTGTFVEKTTEGYRLTPAGIAVVDLVNSGLPVPPDDFGPESLETQCRECHTRHVLVYDGGYLQVRCRGCEETRAKFLFPPRGVRSRESPDAIETAFAAYARSIIDRTVSGVCPYCAGCIEIDSFEQRGRVPEGKGVFVAVCDDCLGVVTVSTEMLITLDPQVISRLHANGTDPRAPLWTQEWYSDAETVERESGTVELTVPLQGETLTVTIDRSATVVAVESEDR